MITLKLIIYSLILFILLVKFSSCQNNIIDLLNIILIITLFNLVLEKIINTNLKENYDPLADNNYSFIDTNQKNKNNSYDFQKVNLKKNNNKNEQKNNETITETEQDIKENEQDIKENEQETNNSNKIEEIKSSTKEIVTAITDNVKNIIDNNIVNKIKNQREEIKLDNKFIYGYSYLHTDNWSIPEKRQPVCKNLNPCKICPNKTIGFNAHLLNYSNISNGK